MKMVRVCYRCKRKVYPSKTETYPFQCFIHDEDLFAIETIEVSEEEYISLLTKRLHCTKEEAQQIDEAYDRYVYDCIERDYHPVKMEKFIKSRALEREARR